jgi:hypothetical protein
MPTSIADLINPANYTTSTNNLILSATNFSSAILPVEFTSFTAQTERTGVMLKWQTAQEENNDYFQIEHSTDGRSFNTLGRIIGNGTANELSDYTYLDDKPASGDNYYRLKQVDYDGAFAYSEIAVAQFRENAVTVAISPNPFTQQVFISLPATEEDAITDTPTTVRVSNVHRQIVHQEILTSIRSYPLDLSKLAAGTYFLQVEQAGNSIATQRLIKL